MTKETVLLRQNFRSTINFLQDFFKSTLVNDVQSGDSMNQLSLEKCIPQTYPLIIDLSNDLLTDNRSSFETHVLSFLFYHSISKSNTMRVYYAVGHRCDYDKANNCLGLTTPNSVNFYAIVVEGQKVHSITARHLGKNKNQFEKNVPVIMCSYTFLPPSPLLLDDSGYLDSLYNTVSKEVKKYCQAFNSALEAVNSTILEEIEHPLDIGALHIYFLNVLLEHEYTEQYKDVVQNLMYSVSEPSFKFPSNALTFTPSEGSKRSFPTSSNAKDFFSNTLDTLKDRANTREEREALEQLKSHFSRQLGFDSGPLKLEQIIKKPIVKASKPVINEYDVKDISTRPFSLTRIQPLNTLLTDQEYEIAYSYQGSKENFKPTEWSSNAHPMLIVEPTSKLTTKNALHLHFIAFTLKEAYTKSINANTMYRYLGYGYPFYFNGQEFKLDEDNLNLYAVILKKGQFTSFSTLNYLSFYERQPTTISLNGKRPTSALDTKFKSALETLALAVKNRESVKTESLERLNEINASYARYLKKNKKQANPKSALEYISNMMLRTANLEFDTPNFAVNFESVENNESITQIEVEGATTSSSHVELNSDSEQINSNDFSPSDSLSIEATENTNDTSVELKATETTVDVPEQSNNNDGQDEINSIPIETQNELTDSPKTIYVNQPMSALELPAISEQNLLDQEKFDVEFIHTPSVHQPPLSIDQVNEIIEMTKPVEKPKPENYAFNVDRTEVVLNQPTNDVIGEGTVNTSEHQISMFANLGIETVEWSSLDSVKYNYSGLSISINKKYLYILEPNTDDAVEFRIKQILSKTDDYYLLKRAVGKDLTKDLRKFIKLKADNDFLAQFHQL